MRKVLLIVFIVVSVFLSGCSFSTSLVVINLSDKPIRVRYQFKETAYFDPGPPKIKAGPNMDDDSPWNDLAADQFTLNKESRLVTATVPPRTAVRLTHISGVGIPENPQRFPLQEVVISGAYGTISLQGEQVRRSFTSETKQVYSILYK